MIDVTEGFPVESMWCAPRGGLVPVETCVNGCVDEAQRRICWMNRDASEGLEGEEVRLSSRDLEHHIALLRNGSSTSLASDQWRRETVLVVDHPNIQQAFEEGWQAALRQMDRTINHLREREKSLLVHHAVTGE